MTATGIELITSQNAYKEIMRDSFGGIMYDVSNQGKYAGTDRILEIWENLTPDERENAGGIVKGAIAFIKEGKK